MPVRLKGDPELPREAIPEGADLCPLCLVPHPLRRHGYYGRWALLLRDHGVEEQRIEVPRLLCARLGRTVSLLPDACLPRRQYGPEALGAFLHLFAVLGKGLLEAFRRLRPLATHHGEAQHLVGGFLRRRSPLTAYVGRLRLRVSPPPPEIRGRRFEVATLLLPLLVGYPDAAGALRAHGVPFHAEFGLGLA